MSEFIRASYFGGTHDRIPEDFRALYGDICIKYNTDYEPSDVVTMWAALGEYRTDQIAKAYLEFLKTPQSKYFPKEHHLREIIESATDTAATPAVLAWNLMRQAMSSCGQRRSVKFPDPNLHYVIERMGGWVALCREQSTQTDQRRAEFIACYRESQQVDPALLPTHVPGQIEQAPDSRGVFRLSHIVTLTTGPMKYVGHDEPDSVRSSEAVSKEESMRRLAMIRLSLTTTPGSSASATSLTGAATVSDE